MFYKLNEFKSLEILQNNWKTIRDEYLQLTASVMNVDRANLSHQETLEKIKEQVNLGVPYGWVKGWGVNGGNHDWIQYGLMAFDEPIPCLGGAMSQTLDFLKSIGGIKVAAFCTLKASSFLPCHRHPELKIEGLLQFHLPIVTAEDGNYAYLNVAGEFVKHECGVPIIFDGSHDHFVVNASYQDRTILYLEFYKINIKCF